MQIEIIQKKPELIEFKLIGETHTFAQLLKHYLLQIPEVKFASYKLEHPMEKDAIFIVRTAGKDAKQALIEANKKILQDVEELRKKIESAYK